MRQGSIEAEASLREDEQFDFVYLDGRHDREGLLLDLRTWLPRVCPGGILAGHDYTDLMAAGALSSYIGSLQKSLGTHGPHSDGAPLVSNPAVVHITADHPASFVLFRPPSDAAAQDLPRR